MRKLLTPSNFGLGVLSLIALVMLVLVIATPDAEPLSPVAGPVAGPAGPAGAVQAPTPPSSVAFVGDGYTSGSPTGGEGPANYTALLADRDGWRVTNPSVYGAGYVAGEPLSSQVSTAADARPQLVVVTAGRADLDEEPSAVGEAAGRLFQDLKTRIPKARVVVIGPMWVGDDAPSEMRDVRDTIRDAATAEQLPFVDPIADRWFISSDQDGVDPDGDLNDRGHQRLAELVGDAVTVASASPR